MGEVEVGTDSVLVDVCHSCRGVWFDWWDGETSGLARHIPAVQVSAPVGRRGGACPRDGAPLTEQPYLDSGPVVERCPDCLGLFARRTQIAALQAFHLRMPERSPEPIERSSLLARLWHAFVR